MAFNDDQVEFPPSADKPTPRQSAEMLPRYFRTNVNKKFLESTLDQLLQPGVAEKLNGYFGRRTAKAFKKDDNYVPDIEPRRENYQLEPVAVIKDNLDNVTFYKDYNDYIGQVEAFGGDVSDHSKLNQQEYYAWNSSIDWDKFTNFREYFWLPTGPTSVPVFGNTREIQSTFTVTVEEQDNNVVYKFSPPGLTPNPTLRLFRGQTYRFEIDCPEYPIAFALSRSFKPGDAILVASSQGVLGPGLFDSRLYDAGNSAYDQGDYIIPPVTGGIAGFDETTNISTIFDDGVTKIELGEDDGEQAVVYVEKGIIEFTVPDNAPDLLYYVSNTDINTSGIVRIFDIVENTELDVNDILGKKTFTTASGFDLTNGLKVKFFGEVTPSRFSESEYIVEGVGDAIKLIDVNDLVIPAAYTQDVKVPFDTNRFDSLPYSNASSFAGQKDYIVINRASTDGNAWTRYNRWFHRDVIEKSAELNGFAVNIDQSLRATRPIIEFEAGLKLFNFGTKSKKDVDLVDTFTKDVFSNIEGQLGYNVDGVDLVEGMRVLFVADTDRLVRGKLYEVRFITHINNRQISLREVEDTDPLENETVLVRQGVENRGKLWYYDGENWAPAQEKLDVNQQPLFDLFDADDNSYGDRRIYPESTFAGNKIFSYKRGSGRVDPELGFPLSYRNIENSGDIEFSFDLLSGSISYQLDDVETFKNTDIAFLRKYSDREDFEYTNGWTRASFLSKQSVIRQYVAGPQLNSYEIDVYDDSSSIEDLWVRVFVNNTIQRLDIDYVLNREQKNVAIVFQRDLRDGDVVLIKTRSNHAKNKNGYYEFPYNFERNPLNENISEFTLGEVNDHVDTMVEDLANFAGVFPGPSNLRDLGNIDGFGKKFLQHSGPLNLALYHITDEPSNIVKSLKFARYEYAKFKRRFLQTAAELGFDGEAKPHVDLILTELNRNKTNSMPFYFSDMVPYFGEKRTEYIVEDPGNVFFALSTPFTLTQLSNHAVTVYLNGEQLLHDRDYTFNDQGFCIITAPKQNGDIIELFEYNNTDGSYIPPTPTKLGLYPAYVPEIYEDDTYVEGSVKVIQGHDGSIIKAFDDFRDELILELEKRIYNNLKQEYRKDIFDIYEFLPGAYRDGGIDRESLESVMVSDFIQWVKIAGTPNFTTFEFVDQNNSLTYNYNLTTNPLGESNLGFWRGIYKFFYDTDRPHSHPWEMLGFTVKPAWWDEQYGPAPYTSENKLLWEDIQDGVVREPGKPVRVRNQFKRPGLLDHIPSDRQGRILSPLKSNFASNFFKAKIERPFAFGDQAPTEAAWRRSSEYPFSLITAFLLNRPARVIGTAYTLSDITRNKAGQLVSKTTEKRIDLNNLKITNTCDCAERVNTAGLVNYIVDYIAGSFDAYRKYRQDLQSIRNQLGFKLSGYTDKTKFKLILDSRTPSNEGNVFVPEENYQIILNRSSTIELFFYSGVVIEKATAGFIIRGYDEERTEFKYNKVIKTATDPVITVGGISESFLLWAAGQRYEKGLIVQLRSEFYRVTESHTSTSSFDESKFQKLPSLPLQGGAVATRAKLFEDTESILTYGTLLPTIQDVVDFLYGYEDWLISQGFSFNFFNSDIGRVENIDLNVREFMFWTTQNWKEGTVITLSPGASELTFEKEFYTVDNVFDNFYDYSLLQADGNILREEFVKIGRSKNQFSMSSVASADGIYALRVPLVQIEHVVLIDNVTVFNDIIYDPAPGYRQERIRALGYRTADWNGSLNIPGFIYDNAIAEEWAPFTDYSLGDVVKYKEFFYSADETITGSKTFVSSQWRKLDSKPEPRLIPNLEYKVNQFPDFYDLDSDNFDVEQQKFAQHLVGYQNREYLRNIINDDVSQYKFYQGFIREKGTRNAISKLFDALSSANKESLEFFEEWAVRQGQYGAADGFVELEYVLEENKFRLEPQPIELVDRKPQNPVDLIYRLAPTDVFVAPSNYDHKPFPLDTSNSEFVKTAGFVNPDDVAAFVYTRDEILDLNIFDFDKKDYVWVAREGESWDVLQLVRINYTVIEARGETDLTGEQTRQQFTLSRTPDKAEISPGSIVGIKGLEGLEKFFEIAEVNGNIITAITNDLLVSSIELTGTVFGVFVSVKAKSLSEINTYAERHVADTSLMWLDAEDTQKVYKNKKAYQKSNILVNPQNWVDNNFDEFANSMSANSNDTVLAVGSPGYLVDSGNITGVVNVYTRPSDNANWLLSQTIEPSVNILGTQNTSLRFGESVAVSPDGRYLAVGAPHASNVITRFEGNYDPDQDYEKGDIVESNGSLWTAQTIIPRQLDNVPYVSFDSYAFLKLQAGDSLPDLVVVGNYGLPSRENTDHILIRAPFDAYSGTEVGDTVVFTWNEISVVNDTLSPTQPFAGFYPDITAAFISKDGTGTPPLDVAGHTISEKVDLILNIENFTIIPPVGSKISIGSATGEVAYIDTQQASMVLYVKNASGAVARTGVVSLSGASVGEYRNDFESETNVVGGFWKISTPLFTTSNDSNLWTDRGTGLVYRDVLNLRGPDGDLSTPGDVRDASDINVYFNTQNFLQTPITNLNQQTSFITHLSYTGVFDVTTAPVPSKFWVFRAPAELTGTPSNPKIAPGDEVGLYLDELGSVDLTGTGLSFDIINSRNHSVFDLWEGYIDMRFTEFPNFDEDGDGRIGDPIEPIPRFSQYIEPPGQNPGFGTIIEENTIFSRVRDLTTGAEADVMFYQRFANTVRLYVKNVSGTWSLGNTFGASSNIQRLGTPNRTMGRIEATSLASNNPNQVPGFLVVVEADEEFNFTTHTAGSNPQVVDEEYWVYEQIDILGKPRSASIPNVANINWRETFNLPANSTGSPSIFDEEGMYSIYERKGQGNYNIIGNFVLPTRRNNARLGSKLRFAHRGDLLTLFVGEQGDNNISNFGKIHFIKNGIEDGVSYEWEIGKDKNYKGDFNSNFAYQEENIVVFQDKLYRAITNVAAGFSFDQDDWVEISETISRLGFVPSNPTIALPQDEIFDPENGIEQFVKDLDANKNGTVLVTATQLLGNDSTTKNAVVVYRENNGNYEFSQIINSPAPDSPGFGATATAILSGTGSIEEITVTNSGLGYDPDFTIISIANNTEEFQGDDSTVKNIDAEAIPIISQGSIVGVDIINPGSGFTSPPTVLIQDIREKANFGDAVSISQDGKLLAIGESLNDDVAINQGRVYIYKQHDGEFVLAQTLTAPNREQGEGFGHRLSFDGNQLAVTSINADIKVLTSFDNNTTTFDNQFTKIYRKEEDTGIVYLYERIDDTLIFADRLIYNDPNSEKVSLFGETIVATDTHIYSAAPFFVKGVDTVVLTNALTNTIRIRDTKRFSKDQQILFSSFGDSSDAVINSGLEESRIYFVREIISDTEFTIAEMPGGPVKQLVTNEAAQYRVEAASARQGLVVSYKKPRGQFTWQTHREQIPRPNLAKFKGAFIYNTRTNSIIENLDILDPVQGKIAGPAEQELAFKTYYDPAFFNVVDGVLDENITDAWGEKHVGNLWWDLDAVRFYNAYQSDIIFQTSFWGKVFPGSSVDVYEWVESPLLPSEWDLISGSERGITDGVSGTTKYGNERYTSKRKYDPVSQRFINRYYYWVKNKTTVPNARNRRISARQVADLITNPFQQGYKFVNLLSDSRFSVHNITKLLEDNNVAINFRYWTVDNQDQNIHNEYQILTEGLPTSRPNSEIERKWFDSLVGFDEFGRPVPDSTLSEKQKYGTLFKPRQSWFRNKTEALKQVVERINSVFLENTIADDYNISRLQEFDPVPTEFSRLYDVSVDIFEELQFIGTANLIQAQLTPVIQDGVITNVEIENPGRGYKVAPTVTIQGSGEGAEIRLEIDNLGKVSNVQIISGGKNYTENSTLIAVRKFAALVKSDQFNDGRWVIYERNVNTETWEMSSKQEFDVRQFWDYVDWYAEGYGQFTPIDFRVEESFELPALNDRIGNIVRIENVGAGGWLLLEKIADEDTPDYTVNYKTIGRQDGTIQFSDKLYNVKGLDITSFDSRYYDILPSQEIRIILETIRDDIFVEELAKEYNSLFFASLRYVFSEQLFVDWAFKTSFVKAIHNVGELEQRINFKNDNLASYEEYVKEVKPYKTKIREYISSYDPLQPAPTAVTDFDLAPVYNRLRDRIITEQTRVENSALTNLSEDLNNFPKKFWKDNVGFQVVDIQIANSGSGYTQAPTITLTGGGGTGATAVAFVNNQRLTNIKIVNPGTGYLSAPTVVINGNIIEGGVEATASAILGNSVVRNFHCISKFDRVSGEFYITNLEQTETFTGVGAITKYTLKWPLDLKTTAIRVLVSGRELLKSEYAYRNVKDTSRSYSRQVGEIIFTNPPATGESIEIRYFKNIHLLTAQDRINLFYEPGTGMIGKDVAQLMDGVDYGGVEVRSLEFAAPAGWDTDPWYAGQWDTFDNTFEDEVFTFDSSTLEVVLSKPLEEGVSYNVYIDGVRIDDPFYDGSTVTSNPNAIMRTLIGDGVTQTLFLDDLGLEDTVSNNSIRPDITIDSGRAVLIIRKSTSDGSFMPDPLSYDVQLSGGDLAYSTAKGIKAEEIIVDGDGFVTPLTSKGPEELVPGQIVDTLDIKVYQRTGSGGSPIYSQAYIADGTTGTFDLGVIPNSNSAVFVRINRVELDSSEYEIDHKNNTLTLSTVPPLGSELHIMTMGFAGDKILDVKELQGDGETTLFETSVAWQANLSFFLNINGVLSQDVELIEVQGRATFRFANAPVAADKIVYGIFYTTETTFSQVKRDNFVGDGSTTAFELSLTPFNSLPISHKIIVKKNDAILNAGYNQRFDVGVTRTYQIQLFQQPSVNILPEQVVVYLNGVQLIQNQTYNWDVFNSSVVLFAGIGSVGDVLEVFVVDDGEYVFENNTVILDTVPDQGDSIEVIQFSNHDIQDIDRVRLDVVNRTVLTPGTSEYKEYHNLTTGLIKLRSKALDAEYVWVIKNGTQLTPSVDYYVTEDRMYVQLLEVADNDVLEIIHFSAQTKTINSFGYRQFKDMLNRTHFKRLNDTVKFELAQDLSWSDLRIELVDAEHLPEPSKSNNVPGVLFINNERIEYFLKEGNTLRQIRRGTLGTGVPEVHPAGTKVENQSITETIPYKDEMISQVFVANGTDNTFILDFIPGSEDEFEVFAAGKRLRKQSIAVFDPILDQDSPEGDVVVDADFSIEGNMLILKEPPMENRKVIVVRKLGLLWAPPGTSLSSVDNDVGRFLRSATVDLPE